MSGTDIARRYHADMARWQPDSAGRLEEAALALFVEHGFDAVTVAEIAAAAGLTERTFFRYFADKREVLFGGSPVLTERMVQAVAAAPADAAPMAAIAEGLEAAGELLDGRRQHAQQRYRVIAASPELRERELIKMASVASAMAAALRERGVAPVTASLAAEAGAAVFGVAFQQWITGDGREPLTAVIRSCLTELADATARP
jgi:AcrR family transcriptional regulator